MNVLCRRKNRIVIFFIVFVLSTVLILASMSLGEFFARDWGSSSAWSGEDEDRYALTVRQAGLLTGGVSGLGLILDLTKLEEKPAQSWREEQN